jgi:hypothetical protein
VKIFIPRVSIKMPIKRPKMNPKAHLVRFHPIPHRDVWCSRLLVWFVAHKQVGLVYRMKGKKYSKEINDTVSY